MANPDFEQARQYALERLERELSPKLVYHSVVHTRDDVVIAVQQYAEYVGIEGEDLLLLKTAAWFHDLGFVEQRQDHEYVGIRIASSVLPDFGYNREQIARISGMIMATKLPQTPHNMFEALLADSDLDSLGRDDFFEVGLRLRTEQANFGVTQSDEEWYSFEITFLKGHEYFTEAARHLRDTGKLRNVEELKKRLEMSRNHSR